MSEPGNASLREAVVAAARAMNASGINHGTSGNVSAREGDGYLITPSGIDYEAMTPDQIVAMDLAGGHTGDWRPSSEWRMHGAIYAARPEAGAVVHVHSPHASALSCLRQDLPAFHYMIAAAGGTTIRCADYATFATRELSDAMVRALEGRRACLLANHGQICFADTLEGALKLAGEVENLCRQYWIARLAGDPVILSEAEMDEVFARFKGYGQQKS